MCNVSSSFVPEIYIQKQTFSGEATSFCSSKNHAGSTEPVSSHTVHLWTLTLRAPKLGFQGNGWLTDKQKKDEKASHLGWSPSNSDDQDYDICRFGDPYKPSCATIDGLMGREQPKLSYMCVTTIMYGSIFERLSTSCRYHWDLRANRDAQVTDHGYGTRKHAGLTGSRNQPGLWVIAQATADIVPCRHV